MEFITAKGELECSKEFFPSAIFSLEQSLKIFGLTQ